MNINETCNTLMLVLFPITALPALIQASPEQSDTVPDSESERMPQI